MENEGSVRFIMPLLVAMVCLVVGTACGAAEQPVSEVLFIAGGPSHSFGEHEHLGGSTILAETINEADVGVTAEVVSGWPEDPEAFEGVDAVVIYADGGEGHPVMDHLEEFDEVMDRGVGLVTIHYAVEVPEDEGGPQFLDWIGGHYETHYSVNPIWTAEYGAFPDHPISRGVEPFSIEDEWYFNIRFRPEMGGIDPILQATPSDETRDGPYVHPEGPYEHIQEAKGETETMAWALEREDGGRGFGFTGGHFHWNWGQEDFQRVVANAIVWSAGAEVPSEGLPVEPITAEELAELADDPIPEDWDPEEVQQMLDEANQAAE